MKIADFGIAKLIGDRTRDVTLTASGAALGTPQYMAPEQLEHPQDVDQRADIYSLGVVFYEMLTGELPIGRFAPPSEKAAVDSRVDEVVFHALEKEREKRFRSAGDVKTSVEAITSHPRQQPGGAEAGPGLVGNPVSANPDRQHSSVCYFSTPDRMRNCFPSTAARIFQCKGELRLDEENLTFVSPWRTSITLPLRDIQDLSVGQFQMWTTPWVLNYARINFLALTFRQDGRLLTVHLTPVPEGATSAGQIDDHVARWWDTIRQAVTSRAGVPPRVSEPSAITISAQPAWSRIGGPLSIVFLVVWLGSWIGLPFSALGPHVPPWAWALLVAINGLLLIAMLFSAHGFFHANNALKHGLLDAVSSEDPPTPGLVEDRTTSHRGTSPRPFGWTLTAWACMVIGVGAVIEALASFYTAPYTLQPSPGLGHLFAGFALLSLNHRWRLTALVALGIMFCWQSYLTIKDLLFSPVTAGFGFPFLKSLFPSFSGVLAAKEGPILFAVSILAGIFVFAWPFRLLTCPRGKALFGIGSKQ